MDTPVSTPPSSDQEEDVANNHRQDVPNEAGQDQILSEQISQVAQRSGTERGQRRPQFGGQGKNQIVPIDQETIQRWDYEIGDVLADTIATSTVILPGPLPVGASIPQAQAPKHEPPQ